jgi:hypothetical protein
MATTLIVNAFLALGVIALLAFVMTRLRSLRIGSDRLPARSVVHTASRSTDTDHRIDEAAQVTDQMQVKERGSRKGR